MPQFFVMATHGGNLTYPRRWRLIAKKARNDSRKSSCSVL
ncbi:hypothetical protein I551_4499 [Mycobacterium ulcerans str. Harvey]|uniref:Uncharacterized protein n=1 Tax=Mycobacterium ulcerans str. Harvey TaxID=1299332 RepID=A0ABN0QWG3_MYCUL|nr:hypothetical protein I551_4499 [Mycobacterium ulcerans str. Harvey]